MKQIVRYRHLTIPGKLTSDIRIIVDDRGSEYHSNMNMNDSTSINLFPVINLSITRLGDVDENGNKIKAPWNPNDSLGMTKYNLPIFVDELYNIQQDMKIPELYTYHGKRLEINEEIASKIRRVFMIGNVTLELTAIVITQNDDSRLEGIKMKFNNEQSSVQLTLNELNSLIFNYKHIDIDSISLLLYLNYVKRPDVSSFDSLMKPEVDIIPK